MTCIRGGDEVTLKACKCKTGSVSLVDLHFRSALLLTAFRGCLFQSCQPLQNTVTVGGDRRLGRGGVCKDPAPLLHSPPPSFASHSNKCCHPPCICCPLYWQVPDLYTTAAQKQQKALTGHHCMLFCLVYVMPLFTSTHDCSLAYNSARTTFMLQRLTVVT